MPIALLNGQCPATLFATEPAVTTLPLPAAPLDDLQRQRLLKLARPLRAMTSEDAAGRCLALSLDIALLARARLKVDLELVRWQVRDDPDYIEHWAVALGDGEVLDPTRAQVDGQTTLTSALGSYPANFVAQRQYPASLLLDLYQPCTDGPPAERLPARVLVACALRICRHDLRLAWRQRSARFAVRTLLQAWTFASVFTLNCLSRGLEARATRLIGRLHPQAEVPARTRAVKAVPAAPTDPAHAARSAPRPGRHAPNRPT